MVQSPPKPLTLEAFLQLPETKPASEYIDGQILQKPRPQAKHMSTAAITPSLCLRMRAIGSPYPISPPLSSN
jgi:hypothetical protein